jgi:hypothetical protein
VGSQLQDPQGIHQGAHGCAIGSPPPRLTRGSSNFSFPYLWQALLPLPWPSSGSPLRALTRLPLPCPRWGLRPVQWGCMGTYAASHVSHACRACMQIIRSLGGSLMAVNSSVAQPQTQVVVDEYATSYCGNNYKVHTMATDLLTYLHRCGPACIQGSPGSRAEGRQQAKERHRIALRSVGAAPFSLLHLNTGPFARSSPLNFLPLPNAATSRHDVKVALVPDVSTAESTTAAAGISQGIAQSSNRVLMVSPTAFGFNEQVGLWGCERGHDGKGIREAEWGEGMSREGSGVASGSCCLQMGSSIHLSLSPFPLIHAYRLPRTTASCTLPPSPERGPP